MKLEVSQDKIKKAVSLAEHITGKNLTLPVLSGILIIAKGKTVTLRSTNLDIGIEISIPAKIESEGITVVPGSILNNLLGSIFDGTIILKSNNDNLEVSTKSTATVIKALPSEDFPTLPTVKNSDPLIISSQKLVTGLKSVWFAASHSDIKPEIASVCMYGDKGEFVFVATDSFRLAEKKFEFSKIKDIESILIPIKNISEIIRVFDNTSDDIEIHWNKNQISFESPSLYLTSRIIDGVFPDYRQIMPKEHKTEAIVLKQDFVNSLRISNLFADKFNQITIIITPHKKVFQLNSKNFDIGENTTHIESTLSGDPVALNFNYKYVLDCLSVVSKDSLQLQFNGNTKPMIIKGIGDKTFTYLVMPLNQ